MRQIFGKTTILWIVLTACNTNPWNGNPRQAGATEHLKNYISKSFSVKNVRDRAMLLEDLTGTARLRLEAWSDDQFEKAFLGAKREFLKLEYKEVKPLTDRETAITYEVSYRQRGPNAGHGEIVMTHRKISTLVQESGNWKIKDVKHVKELVTLQDEMTLP